MPENKSDRIIYAFCDESAYVDQRYLVAGSIFLMPKELPGQEELYQTVEQRLNDQKAKQGLFTEIKWGEIPSKAGKQLVGYKKLLGFYLDNDLVSFRCMVVDTHNYPLKSLSLTNKETGLGYRNYLSVFLADGLMKTKDDYYFKILLDTRDTKPEYRLEDLFEATNNRLMKNVVLSKNKYASYFEIQQAESKDWCLLQVADILIGAIAAKWNGTTTARGKLEIITFIEQKLNWDLLKKTPPWYDRFNIWEFKPKVTS
ncbi:MAG: DUF3800 domain-containing protein [Chloroflexi bacterium]|nr:DUF3800 domain-containing protein [Chloroflexota bacterium]